MLLIVKAETELTCLNLNISFAQLAEAAETYLKEVGLDPEHSVDDPVPSAFAAGTEYHEDFWPDDELSEISPLFVSWLLENGHAEREDDVLEVELA